MGEVYRYDPHYRKGTKREPIQIILYWRPGQKVVVEDDPAYFEAFQNKLRIERIKYFKNRVPNPVYDGDNQDFYFSIVRFLNNKWRKINESFLYCQYLFFCLLAAVLGLLKFKTDL